MAMAISGDLQFSVLHVNAYTNVWVETEVLLQQDNGSLIYYVFSFPSDCGSAFDYIRYVKLVQKCISTSFLPIMNQGENE